jgi:hypothetical protein
MDPFSTCWLRSSKPLPLLQEEMRVPGNSAYEVSVPAL